MLQIRRSSLSDYAGNRTCSGIRVGETEIVDSIKGQQIYIQYRSLS